MKKPSVRIKPEEFKKWNDNMAKKYDPDAFHHHPNPIIRFIETRRVKTIIGLTKPIKEDRILEVGCGGGNILDKVPVGKLFGVDISDYILSKAKQKLNKKVFLFQADALNLPFKNNTFRKIISSEVLEHLLDPTLSLKEIARILNQQGVAVISIPNEFWINRLKRILIGLGIFDLLFHLQGEYREMPERMEDEWHLHAFPLDQWLNLMKTFFRVTRLRKIPFFWLPLRFVIRLEKIR